MITTQTIAIMFLAFILMNVVSRAFYWRRITDPTELIKNVIDANLIFGLIWGLYLFWLSL